MSFVLFKQTLAPGAIAPSVRKRSTPVALPSLPNLLQPHLLLPSPAPEPAEAVVLEAMEESPPSASLPPSPPEAMLLLDRRRWLRRGQPHPCKPSPAPLHLPNNNLAQTLPFLVIPQGQVDSTGCFWPIDSYSFCSHGAHMPSRPRAWCWRCAMATLSSKRRSR